jgi:hypothetical protein
MEKAQTIRRLLSVLRPLAGRRRLRFSFFANELVRAGGGQTTEDRGIFLSPVVRPPSSESGLVAQLVRARA